MSKIKAVLLVILVALLVDFAVENAAPSPPLKLLFKFELGHVPIFSLVYGGLALGLLIGWLGHFFRVKRKKKAAQLAAAKQEEPGPSPEQPQ